MTYKYQLFQRIKDKTKCVFNENEKPNINEYKSKSWCESGNCSAYQDDLKQWQSKHITLDMDEIEVDKVKYYEVSKIQNPRDRIFWRELCKIDGVQVYCIEVRIEESPRWSGMFKDIPYFKPPLKEDKPVFEVEESKCEHVQTNDGQGMLVCKKCNISMENRDDERDIRIKELENEVKIL
jgi:hypothetical protein